jgi:hypothetical protein
MKSRLEILKRLVVFTLALSVFILSLNCLAICACHADRSSCAAKAAGTMLIGYEDECCPLDTVRSVPPERIQKTPASHISRPLPTEEIFGIHHHLTLNPIAGDPLPSSSPPLQRIPVLRI